MQGLLQGWKLAFDQTGCKYRVIIVAKLFVALSSWCSLLLNFQEADKCCTYNKCDMTWQMLHEKFVDMIHPVTKVAPACVHQGDSLIAWRPSTRAFAILVFVSLGGLLSWCLRRRFGRAPCALALKTQCRWLNLLQLLSSLQILWRELSRGSMNILRRLP